MGVSHAKRIKLQLRAMATVIDFAWPRVASFCDARTRSAIQCSQAFPSTVKDQLRRVHRNMASTVMTTFFRSCWRSAPWRRNHPFDLKALDMNFYSRIMGTSIGRKFHRYTLLRYALSSNDAYRNGGAHMYLFSFRSRDGQAERLRESLRESYEETGSRYLIGRFILTLTHEEVLRHGI